MNDSLLNIEIDGKPCTARRGAMLIEVADEAGIRIPRFCYHKKLSVAANCRMCLVEVEKAPKPLPACATPVMDGMKVFTRSPLARDAQKSVMEFLLINHPLDCPICDQGGECELQDVAMGYGRDVSRFNERKRVVPDKNLGSLIATDMTRCIHCTRCVRFGEEVGGLPELGATGRGEDLRIGTFIERTVDSEMSGNVIDLCPVGALTSKPYRFRARAWELQQADGVAPHDAVGSNVHVHIARGRVMRVVPRENESINEVWISDRDRFGYEGLYSEDRLERPAIKQGGQWHEVDWEAALAHAADGLRKVVDSKGASSLGVLASPSATVEESYLLQKVARGLGSANVDHRLNVTDTADQGDAPAFPWLGLPIADIESQDAVLLIGSWTRKEHPIINHRLRKMSRKGGAVLSVNVLSTAANYELAENHVVPPQGLTDAIIRIAGKLGASVDGLSASGKASDAEERIAKTLDGASRCAVLLGPGVASHPEASTLRAIATQLAENCGATLGELSSGANAAGAWIAGAVPHRAAGGGALSDEASGLTANDMLSANLGAYILHGIEPELDCANSAAAQAAMAQADFVVATSAYATAAMREYADVLLPIGLYAETSGTYVNMEGVWQSFTGAVLPPGEARPAWKVLRVLGNGLALDGFEYMDSSEVCAELKAGASDASAEVISYNSAGARFDWSGSGMSRIGYTPIYAVDPIVRRAPALQATQDARADGVRMCQADAQALSLDNGDEVEVRQHGNATVSQVVVDDAVPAGAAAFPAGVLAAVGLGPAFGPMEVVKR